jgi:hypothetical protein
MSRRWAEGGRIIQMVLVIVDEAACPCSPNSLDLCDSCDSTWLRCQSEPLVDIDDAKSDTNSSACATGLGLRAALPQLTTYSKSGSIILVM